MNKKHLLAVAGTIVAMSFAPGVMAAEDLNDVIANSDQFVTNIKLFAFGFFFLLGVIAFGMGIWGFKQVGEPGSQVTQKSCWVKLGVGTGLLALSALIALSANTFVDGSKSTVESALTSQQF